MRNALERIRGEVFGRRPVLARIYETSGNRSVFDYVQSWDFRPANPDSLFFLCLKEELSRLYPADAELIARQFLDTSLVSTIDHHGILNHPIFLNSNFIHSLRQSLQYMIVLPTAGVSMNNASSYSGSLLWTHAGNLERISLFPNRFGMHPVFSVPGFGSAELSSILKKISDSPLFSGRQKEILLNTVDMFFQPRTDIKTFSDQCALISAELWSGYFPEALRLVYVPLEDVINKTITALLKQKHPIFYELICASRGWELLDRHFSGVAGAFSGPRKGSFLFWGIDSQGRRVHMTRDRSNLSGDGFGLALNDYSVMEALAQRKIYPSSLLCFMVLLYFQVTCLGGFTQTSWLTEIQKRFVSLLEEMGDYASAEAVGKIYSDYFSETNAVMLQEGGTQRPATGMDILFAGPGSLYERYRGISKRLTLKASIDTMLPEIYRVVFSSTEQDKHLIEQAESSVAADRGIQELYKI